MSASQGVLLACVVASVLFQAVAAVLALRLVRLTGGRLAWISFAVGLTLMAVRRAISLWQMADGAEPSATDLGFELVGLATSGLMLAGIALIRPLFQAVRDSEEAMRRMSEERRLLVEHTNDIVYRQGPDGVFTYVSPACEKVTGLSPEAWKQHYDKLLSDNPENERCIAATERALKTGEQQPSYEVEVLHANGSRVWLEVSERPFAEGGRVTGLIGVARDITARRANEAERDKLIGELRDALAHIKTLRGFLPICASCKKIRDDQGYWSQIESYLRDHADVQFSHGICPDCSKKLYPEYCDEPASQR